MKDQVVKQAPTYTAREVVEILARAKELGVTMLRLEGFEAAFEPQKIESRPAQAPPVGAQGKEPQEELRCPVCSSTDIRDGKDGEQYCFPCFKEEKKQAGKWRGR